MGLRSPIDYTAPLDSTSLIVEVASSAYAFKSKIKAASIKLLWEKLSESVASTLKQQKGCLLPNLGTFKVGPVIGEAKKKIRPVFVLLEGRYGNISQERARYTVGGRAPIVQPSYSQLSIAAGVHKGATQRLVAELLQRLSVHILAGRPIRCEFPGLGMLLTNRAGRMEFVFEPLFMEHFEREHYALIKEMDVQVDVDGQDDISNRMQASSIGTPTVHHPFSLQNGAAKVNGVIRPVSPLIHGSVQPSRSHTPAGQQQQPAATGRTAVNTGQRQAVLSARHATFTGELHKLHQLCMQADRIHAGTVQRSLLEGFLQADVRSLMSQVDAVTVLDLLSTYTCGKTRSLVVYLPFLQALQNLLALDNPGADPVRQQYKSSPTQHHEEIVDHDQLSELSFNPASPNPNTNPPIVSNLDAQQAPYQIHPQPQYPPQQYQQYQQNGMAEAFVPQQPRDAVVSRQSNSLQQQPMPGTTTSAPQPAMLQQGLNVAIPPSPTPSQPEQYIHYMQQQLSPRSRAEYDSFNKVHFEHLRQMRGDTKRALTPKVNEEPLNKTEFRAVRQASPTSGWLATPTHDNPAPPHYQPYLSNGITQAPTPQRPPPAYTNTQPALPSSAAATYNSSPAPTYTTQRPVVYPAHAVSNHINHTAAGYAGVGAPSPAPPVVPGLPLTSYVTSPAQIPLSPQRGYHPRDHVQDILHDLPKRSTRAQQQLSYQEPPQISPRQPPFPISYYDIQSARDPVEKQRLKTELANELQQSWQRQIETRHEFERAVEQAEKSGWPYNLSHNPNDKRPVSAISRPLASPRRMSRP